MLRQPGPDLARLRRRLHAAIGRTPAPAVGPAIWCDTSIERAVAAMLDQLGAAYEPQWRGLGNVAIDFYVPSAHLVIECQGTWYHGDPQRYERRELNRAQRHKRAQDAALQQLARRAGLTWLELWEEDIRNRPEWCRQQLRRWLSGTAGEDVMSTRICSVTTESGCDLAVHHGDLTTEPVDAIVNAANTHLAHGGGVAGAIVRRGGGVIQLESDDWVRRYGPVPTGGVAVTTAGSLACRLVIHAVGPIWRDGRDEPELLRSAVRASLACAAERRLTSVALPAISSGIYGFPKPLCAEILVDTAVEFCREHPDFALREIRFTNYDQPTVDVFAAEFERRFGDAVAT